MMPLRQNLEKILLLFSIEGITPRDELLLKSLVRILNHRTEHTWQYTAECSDEQVDLRVIGDGSLNGIELRTQHYLHDDLIRSTAQQSEVGFLALPLRANLLELELNRLGQLIKTRLEDRSAPSSKPIPGTTSSTAPIPPELVPIFKAPLVRLSRWPSANLLNSAEKLKMATLLVGRSITAAGLAEASNYSLSLCNEFINELRNNDLVIEDSTPVIGREKISPSDVLTDGKSPRIANPARGLLSLIRNRLGL